MRAPVGPDDFLTALLELGADSATSAELARVFGYTLEPNAPNAPMPLAQREQEPESQTAAGDETDVELPATESSDFLAMPAVLEASASPPEATAGPEWWARTRALEEETPGQAAARTPPLPLFEPRRQRDILRALLTRRVPGRRVDADALSSLLVRQLPYDRVPMRLEARLARSVAIVALRSPQLDTFEYDLRLLARDLRSLVGSSGVQLSSVREAPDVLPAAESVLAVMRGRAKYEGDPSPAVAWFDAANLARASGASVHALSPETVEKQLWRPLRTIEWSRRTSAAHVTKPYRAPSGRTRLAMVELATLLSPAMRVEPALLRRMRLDLLPDEGPEIEAELRSSRWIATSNSLGFALRPEIRKRLLHRLERHPQRQRAFDCVEEAHRSSTPVLKLEERLVRLAHERPEGWRELAEAALRQATRALTPARAGLAEWVERAAGELPRAVRETVAFGEAATRSAAVLGREIAPDSSNLGLAPELAKFLREGDSATQEVEIVAVNPEGRGLTADDLVGLSGNAFRAAAKKLNTSLAWLNGLKASDNLQTFRMDLVRRTLEREMGRSEQPIKVLLLGDPARTEVARQALAAIPYVSLEVATGGAAAPRADSANVAFLAFDDPRSQEFLRRTRAEPSFIACLLTGENGAATIAPATQAYLEVIELGDPNRVRDEIQSLLVFAGRSTRLRLSTRPAQEQRASGRLSLTALSLQALSVRAESSRQATSVSGQPTEVPRQTLEFTAYDHPVGKLRVIPDLWIARLYRSACRVVDASGEVRTGCVVNERFVATAAQPAGKGQPLAEGDDVGVNVGGASPLAASVRRVIDGLAVIELKSHVRLAGSLRVPETAPISGLAVALVHYGKRGLGHLYWGHVVREYGGSSFVLQGPRPATLPAGVSVLVEGLYAGQLMTLVQLSDGRWAGRLLRAERSFFEGETHAKTEHTDDAYGYDVFVTFPQGSTGARELVNALHQKLSEILGRTPRFFRDAQGLEAGEDWYRLISEPMLGSRTMLTLLEPGYFGSEHARRKWALFEARSEVAKRPLLFPAIITGDLEEFVHLTTQVADLRSTNQGSYASHPALEELARALAHSLESSVPRSAFGPPALELEKAAERARQLEPIAPPANDRPLESNPASPPADPEVVAVLSVRGDPNSPELVERVRELQQSLDLVVNGMPGPELRQHLDSLDYLKGVPCDLLWPDPTASDQHEHFDALCRTLHPDLPQGRAILLALRGVYPFAKRTHRSVRGARYDDTFVLLTPDAPVTVFRGATYAEPPSARSSAAVTDTVTSIRPGRYVLRAAPEMTVGFRLTLPEGDEQIPAFDTLDKDGVTSEDAIRSRLILGSSGMSFTRARFRPGYDAPYPVNASQRLADLTAPLAALNSVVELAGSEIDFILADAAQLAGISSNVGPANDRPS